MADNEKITEIDELTSLASTDLLVGIDDVSGTPTTNKVEIDTLDDYLSATTKTLTNKTLTSAVLNTGVSGTAVLDEDAMTSNSATKVVTQQSIKAYVDSGTVTMTNKTLTTPIVASLYQDAGKTKLMTVPNTASDTLAAIAATQTLTNKTLTSPVLQGTVDGWISANESWAYASATTITIPAGGAAKYAKGDKIKLTQTTAKYFYVVGVADTVLTVTGGSDYTVADAAITLPFYSHQTSPIGHPIWFNWTPTYTGFATDPTVKKAKFKVDAVVISIYYIQNAKGTSNANNFIITLPIACTEAQPLWQSVYGTDNSTDQYCWYSTGADANLDIRDDPTTNSGWTTSNNKGIYGVQFKYTY